MGRREYHHPEPGPEVLEAVRQAAVDGRVSCAALHRVAERLGVPVPVVGRAADRLGLKITACQLGCF
ncbi:MAG: hypothetical protein QMC81_10190 [Thermoanaerobacterales bacterium]|nr:hypothetical protein [Bacillota bacterium]MDI6907835.1 hypothetical protein [Thermoanaerobacterales bacterium]